MFLNQHGPKLTDPGCIPWMYFNELRLKSCRNILPQCLCVNVFGIYFVNASTGLARKQCRRPPATYTCFFLGTTKQHATENNVATQQLVAAQPFEDIDPQSQHNLLESFWFYNIKTSRVFDAIIQQLLISSLPL